MEFRVLGPLEVYDASGAEIRLPGGRERALLVALLLRRGEVVSVDALIDALWGERAPSTAPKAVQGYVSHLRRALGAAGEALVTQPPGYVLRVTDDEVDAAQFERLAADGRRALEDGDPAEALSALDSALATWRGPALAEFAFEDFAQPEIQRLTERRLEVQEDRANALLGLGRHAGLVAELESLVQAHPERERLRGQLMLALYRAGRQADALRVYRDGRRLANELGLDPSPSLRQLERAILDHDPEIAAPARAHAQTAEPVRDEALPGRAADEAEVGSRQGRRRRGFLVVGAALAIAAVVAAALLVRGRSEPGAATVVAPTVAVVDPASNRVTTTVRVGSRPVSIAAGEGAVWVGDASDATVTRIDPATLATKSIGIGAPAIDLAVADGGVWVATGSFGTVVRIDAELESVADRNELGEPGNPVVPAASSIAAGPEGVWLGAFDGLVRLDPGTGTVLDRVNLGSTPAQQIALGNGAVWATTIASRAKRLEARSAQVTAQFHPGPPLFAIAIAGNAAWVGGAASVGADQGQLWRIHAVTGSQESSTRVGSWPAGIAIGEGAVWVTLPGSEALLRIDPESGETEATIPLGGWAEEVVVADGRVWVTVRPPETEG